jgi:deoxyribose-phosphate aldolase
MRPFFVKSSTGFYQTEKNLPNGATVKSVILMLENASPLPINSWWCRTYEEAFEMVRLGVKRIGTSEAKKLPMEKHEIRYSKLSIKST